MARTVLFLHSSAGRYGADLQLLTLATGLDGRRWRPVAILPERGELAPALERAGVEVHIRELAVLRRGLLSVRGAAGLAARLASDRRELGRLAREHAAALVHSNTSVVLGGQAAARAAGAPHVMHVREIYEGVGKRGGNEPAGGRLAAVLWPAWRRRLLGADAVVCISEAVAAQFRGAPNATVIRDGLPRAPEPADRDTARRELGVPPDRFTVALLGRVSDWKGQDVLAQALAAPSLAEIGAVGLVAGDAFPGNEWMEDTLVNMRDRLGLGERLKLLGFREDLGTVLGASDAVVVPSRRPEPLGLVALEAAAAGLPVVASAHGGLTEIVREGQTGRLVAPGDPSALADALRALADDPQEARRLGSAAALDVRERFAAERMLAEVEALYERLLQGLGAGLSV